METFQLVLSREEVEIIGQGLYELPYKLSHPIITHIQKQIIEQSKKPSPEVSVPDND